MVPADSDRIPRAPPYSGGDLATFNLPIRDCHPLRSFFPKRSGSFNAALSSLLQPRRVLERTGLGSAPFARHYSGYRLFFLFLRVLRCFSSPGSPQLTLVPALQAGGLPHSDIRGSIPVCKSPRLFAAYHVLLRLLEPRHPPFALSFFFFASATAQYDGIINIPYEFSPCTRSPPKLKILSGNHAATTESGRLCEIV